MKSILISFVLLNTSQEDNEDDIKVFKYVKAKPGLFIIK
jgi:hypothetical protein